MAFFAKLESNVVVDVVVVNNSDMEDNSGVPSEAIGIGFLTKTYGAATNWKQSPKGNAAGIGMTYITNVATLGVASTDVFIEQQPYASWTVGVSTANWFCPLGNAPAVGVGSTGWYDWDEAAYQADTGSPKTVGWAYTTTR